MCFSESVTSLVDAPAGQGWWCTTRTSSDGEPSMLDLDTVNNGENHTCSNGPSRKPVFVAITSAPRKKSW